jgi:hypothetical protein
VSSPIGSSGIEIDCRNDYLKTADPAFDDPNFPLHVDRVPWYLTDLTV